MNAKWKYICRFDLPSAFKLNIGDNDINDLVICQLYHKTNEKLKVWGFRDWICIGVENCVYYVHLTNIVLHRRYLYHQYLQYTKEFLENANNNMNDDIYGASPTSLEQELDRKRRKSSIISVMSDGDGNMSDILSVIGISDTNYGFNFLQYPYPICLSPLYHNNSNIHNNRYGMISGAGDNQNVETNIIVLIMITSLDIDVVDYFHVI